MAENLLRAWWDRLRGTLQPRPCPWSFAWVLDLPFRAWHAPPSKILGAFDLKAGQRVLEIGPGTGFYAIHAAPLVGPEGAFLALDIQLPMLLELRRRNQKANGAPMKLLQASATEIPLGTASLDHAYLTAVLGEIPDRPAALREIRRVLRPGGRLSVSEQLPDPDYVTLGTLRRELTELGFVEDRSHGWWTYTSTWRMQGTVPDQV